MLFEFCDVTVANPDGSTRIEGLDAVLPDHGVTVIAGPSGSGKSTLLRLCNRLEVPTSGRVCYRDRPIEDLDPLRLRREVAMVFQRAIALPGTVAANLRAGAPTASDAEVDAMLERLGLSGLDGRDATELSGGETQRMALGRALMVRPRYMLFDEPTSSLDPEAAMSIEQLAMGLSREGIACAWVTHDLAQMHRLAHHLIVMVAGRAVQQGHLDDVLDDPGDQVEAFLEGHLSAGDARGSSVSRDPDSPATGHREDDGHDRDGGR